ncbi:hypothetical protein ACFXO9_23905 [Nocardia tengchongensis]|uniref:hypothetical protein n=1 Tax=Nocardia tengchongensis TaxID=2055889 RepID=UPI0036C093F2
MFAGRQVREFGAQGAVQCGMAEPGVDGIVAQRLIQFRGREFGQDLQIQRIAVGRRDEPGPVCGRQVREQRGRFVRGQRRHAEEGHVGAWCSQGGTEFGGKLSGPIGEDHGRGHRRLPDQHGQHPQ